VATIAEQLAALPLVDNLNRNSPEEPIAAPWEKPSFPTEIGYLESGWGYYPHGGAVICAALYGAVTLPAGGSRGWGISTELRQKSSSIAGVPFFEVWSYLAKAAKTGFRAAAYQEEAEGTKYKIVLEKWVAGVKETLGEVAGVTIKGQGSVVGGCLAIVYLGGTVYAFTREETAQPFVERVKKVTAVPAGEYAGIGATSATAVSFYPAVMNFRMGEIGGPGTVLLQPAAGAAASTAAITAATAIPLAASAGTATTTAALKADTDIVLGVASGSSSSSLSIRVKQAIQRLRTREAMPMRMYLLATTPSGATYRWGEDEPGADNVFGDLVDSDTVPGGYKELECSLPRKPGVDYSDMTMGTMLELFGAGRLKVGEYRLERAPRSSGDTLTMDPAAYGYQNHLSDDESAQEIFLDADLNAWGEPTVARRLQLTESGIHLDGATSVGRSPLEPAGTAAGVINDFTGTNNNNQSDAEAHYYGGGVDIGEVRYDYRQLTAFAIDTTIWESTIALGTTDLYLVVISGTNHGRFTALQQKVEATGPGYKWARLRDKYNNAAYTGQLGDVIAWQHLFVIGRHGIPIIGTWPELGVLASDVMAYAIARWAPLLRFTKGAQGTIRPTNYAIPHLAFKETGAIAEWINQANRFELNEWGVWNDRTFYLNPRGEREGRKRWVARVSPAHLQETGPQMERVWNGVVVEYQDVSGDSRTVGPPGAVTTYTDSRLLDEDPLNVANQISGLRRWTKISANGASTPEGAIRIGQLFLEQTKELDGSGSATLNGYVEDENGTLWPYYCIHAGDLIRFPDAAEPGWRYIVNAQRSRGDRSVSIDLDAPPDSMSALLERLDVVLVGLAV
jgi:hypothetical protein